MRYFLSLVALASFTACSTGALSPPPTLQSIQPRLVTPATTSAYHIIQTANSVAAVTSTGKLIAKISVTSTAATTTFASGRVEVIKYAQMRTGHVDLGDGRTLDFPSRDKAVLRGPNGAVLSTAQIVPGGIQLTTGGHTTFMAQKFPTGTGAQPADACFEDQLAYDVSFAAEIIAIITVDPVGALLAAFGCELAVRAMNRDCPR